jgi:hypothetical protein
MFKTEYVPITDYLAQEQITKHELLKQAVCGEVELLLYMKDITGTFRGKDNWLRKEKHQRFEEYLVTTNNAKQSDVIIITNALLKITKFQCEQLMLNNASEIPIKPLLEFYEGEFKFQVTTTDLNNKLKSLDYVNITVNLPKDDEINYRLFCPIVFDEKDINKSTYANYAVKPCAKPTDGKELHNIYCYHLPIEKILVVKKNRILPNDNYLVNVNNKIIHTQLSIINNCSKELFASKLGLVEQLDSLEQYHKVTAQSKVETLKKLISGELKAFIELGGKSGLLEYSAIFDSNREIGRDFKHLIDRFGGYSQYKAIVVIGVAKLCKEWFDYHKEKFLFGNNMPLDFGVELQKGSKLRVFDQKNPNLFSECNIEYDTEILPFLPYPNHGEKDDIRDEVKKCKYGDLLFGRVIMNNETYCYSIPQKNLLVLNIIERAIDDENKEKIGKKDGATFHKEYLFKRINCGGKKHKYKLIFEDDSIVSTSVALRYLYFLIKNENKEFTKIDLLVKTRNMKTFISPKKTSLKSLKAKRDIYLERRSNVLEFLDTTENKTKKFNELLLYLQKEAKKEEKTSHHTIEPNFEIAKNKKISDVENYCKGHIERFNKVLNSLEDNITELESLAKPAKNANSKVQKAMDVLLESILKNDYPKLYKHLKDCLQLDSKWMYKCKDSIKWTLE